MTTDNRTNEQIVAEAITSLLRDVYRVGPEGLTTVNSRVVEALQAAGRLAEPSMSENNVSETVIGLHFSEAQVEAAAKAMWDLRKLQNDPEWGELERGGKRREYRKDARAALVAAASAEAIGGESRA